MEKVKVRDLRITYEDEWLKKWVSLVGDSVYCSPQYLCLKGIYEPLFSWMTYRNLQPFHKVEELVNLSEDLKINGQKQPIKIYRDMRINTGHKRAAVFAAENTEYINAEYVDDDYKL